MARKSLHHTSSSTSCFVGSVTKRRKCFSVQFLLTDEIGGRRSGLLPTRSIDRFGRHDVELQAMRSEGQIIIQREEERGVFMTRGNRSSNDAPVDDLQGVLCPF